MSQVARTLEIRTSPHLSSGASTEVVMRSVVVAALPAAGFAVYAFGLAALLLLGVATASCVATEEVACRLSGRPSTVGDWSAAATGLLYGLTLPPGLPLWMVAVGGVFAIALGKLIFGGLGGNMFNPALVGRAVLQAAFPVAMTTWSPAFSVDRFQQLFASTLALPFRVPTWDAVTGATPLAAFKFEGRASDGYDLALGFVSGSTGETSSVAILVGGAYLALRKMLSWRIPAAVLLTVAAIAGAFHLWDAAAYPSPAAMLFSGGLIFGAVFMATDPVTSPLTTGGMIVFGVLIGALVMVIRLWGGLPEGVMYSILLANACVPLIDRWILTRPYGTGGRRRR